ncbi:cellular nucleic acid-binding protein-like [Belonocnema kinseyi]|uniref:cellular nucleic acid-binding protein-like n=1 Tax=Belonocnema kinseyi TaxID=2817044 RepID=UPI00143CF5E9|nr:cellular nucleic acid-binding protein-like [Belonocnema kinseyi]
MAEEMAEKLARAGHLKVGWVSCRVRKKKDTKRCYRCLGFGHVAEGCNGPDRTRGCFRCGKEGHKSAECNSASLCFLCAAKEENSRTDHLPGSMRFRSFREATSVKKPQERPN